MMASAPPLALIQPRGNKNKTQIPHRGLPPPPPDALSPPPHPVAPLAFSQLLEEMNLFPTLHPACPCVNCLLNTGPLTPRASYRLPPAWLLTPAPPPAPGLKAPLSEGLPGPPGPTTSLVPSSLVFSVPALTSVPASATYELICHMSVSSSTEAPAGQRLVLLVSRSTREVPSLLNE